MDDDLQFCSPPGGTPVWFDDEAHQSGFVAEDENPAAAYLLEGSWTDLTQPCGSGNELENQIQGQSDGGSLTIGDYGVVLEIPPQRTSSETMNPQRRAAIFSEGPSPTQPCGRGREWENQLRRQLESIEDAVGLPGPSSGQGIDDLTSHDGLMTNSLKETMDRRRKAKRENCKRHRGSNWSPGETSCFLKHMETAVAENRKSPWRAVSEAMKREGHDRDKNATENRWGVLLQAYDNNDSRILQVEWRECMKRILHVRPRVRRKLRSATPAPPSPSSGNEIEGLKKLKDLMAEMDSLSDQWILTRQKFTKLLRKQKHGKRKIRGGLGSDDNHDERTKPP